MTESELLERIATTLRQDVGPAVVAEYPKTQAFMAAVVLQKLGRQLDLAPAHRAAETADMTALLADLATMLASAPVPPVLEQAVASLDHERTAAALCAVIATLYEQATALTPARADALLARVRKTLRADIDRRVEYAA